MGTLRIYKLHTHIKYRFDTSPCHACCSGCKLTFCLACQLRKSTTCDDVKGLSNGNGNFFPCHFAEFDAPGEFYYGNVDIKSCSCDFRVHMKNGCPLALVLLGTRPLKIWPSSDAKSVKLAAKGNMFLPISAQTCERMRKSGRTKEGHLRAWTCG